MKDKQSHLRWIPGFFVLLWSTGFIGARYGLPYAEPFTLLTLRMYITLVSFFLLIRLMGAHWPDWRGVVHSMVVGCLIHSCYLGGVFAAIDTGMAAGLVSLLVGLQPILTAVFAWIWLGEKLGTFQTFGFILGLAGVALVLLLGSQGPRSVDFTPAALVYALVALLGISLGTLYQKRFCSGIHLLTTTFFQYLATALIMTFLAFTFETREVLWTPTFVLTLLWLVFGLSVTAILLLMRMIREGEAAKVASYFYLTPPVTALLAWILFKEQLNTWSVTGMLVAIFGVYLVVRTPGRIDRRRGQ